MDLICETDRAEGDLEANNDEFDQNLYNYLNFQSHKSSDVFLHHYKQLFPPDDKSIQVYLGHFSLTLASARHDFLRWLKSMPGLHRRFSS